MNLLLLVAGVALLYAGGELLVRGAAALGGRFGMSPLVIGLTIISIGTSSPELAASMAAVFQDSPDVALGNVIGSNIANLALVLGLTALVWPLTPNRQLLRREAPVMILSGALMLPLLADGAISRTEGLILCALLTVLLYAAIKGQRTDSPLPESHSGASTPRQVVNILAGIALLVLGAKALVTGAVGIARAFEVSERVIGLTIVAFGTSLPELASSIVAALKRQSDIVLGNLIGSNIFNVLFILGVTASVHPIVADTSALNFDLWVMLGVSVLAWILLCTGRILHRWEGALLCAIYLGYVIRLF